MFYTKIGVYESVQGKDPDGVPLAEAINPSYVQEILETPWSGKNYSEKIWDLTADFEKKLSETLTQGLVQGKHPNEMARDFRKLGVGKEGTGGIVHRAETLMQTEAANIIEQATLKGYAATKIDEYEFMTAKDGKVCGICADINKERFPCDKAITGTNYPPMHPRCRCTTVPVTPYSNEDPNEQYVYETDYDEWYDTYCADAVDEAYAKWAKENGVDLEDELNVHKVAKKKTADIKKPERYMSLQEKHIKQEQGNIEEKTKDSIDEESEKAYNKAIEMGLTPEEGFKDNLKIKKECFKNLEELELHDMPVQTQKLGESCSIIRLQKNKRTILRFYDNQGYAFLDIDLTPHGNRKKHPVVPHRHLIEFVGGKPKRESMHNIALTASDILAIESILENESLLDNAIAEHKKQYTEESL